MLQGFVYLVGAGPGAEDLLTLRGKECLEQAEVVIYDHLANPRLLKHCRQDADLIYVGKQAHRHTMSQEGINNLLCEHARAGRIVTRLKGGDPFLFGRGGEEALALVKQGLPFEIVPGVTAAAAAAACAGIPLTHRDFAASVALVTGHKAANKTDDGINWEHLAHGVDTLVFYMGVGSLPGIASRLLKQGRSPSTPAAVIAWGSLPVQKTVTGSLDEIATLAVAEGIRPPALIVIGDVVTMREKLLWFEKRPLFRRRIAVTRGREQASGLINLLLQEGADVRDFPTISIRPRADLSPLDRELTCLDKYGFIVFTSVNSVHIFCDRLLQAGYDARLLHGIRLIVIGEETGRALTSRGLIPDLIPGNFTSEGTITAIRDAGFNLPGQEVLIPCSAIARDHIPRELREMGARVTLVSVYENEIPTYTAADVENLFSGKEEVFFTFTSPSTVNNLVSILTRTDCLSYLSRVRGFSIGPVTSHSAAEAGIPVLAEASPHRIPVLGETIIKYFKDSI